MWFPEAFVTLWLLWQAWRGYRRGLVGVLGAWLGFWVGWGVLFWLFSGGGWNRLTGFFPGMESASMRLAVSLGILIGVQVVFYLLQAFFLKASEQLGVEAPYRWTGVVLQVGLWWCILGVAVYGLGQTAVGVEATGVWLPRVGSYLYQTGALLVGYAFPN